MTILLEWHSLESEPSNLAQLLMVLERLCFGMFLMVGMGMSMGGLELSQKRFFLTARQLPPVALVLVLGLTGLM